jgi:hypothetical protein
MDPARFKLSAGLPLDLLQPPETRYSRGYDLSEGDDWVIRNLRSGFDVSRLVDQLDANPHVWNTHKLRTEAYGTPHLQVSDIWVRYNAWENYDGDAAKFVLEPHKSEWYGVTEYIPAVVKLVVDVFNAVEGRELGGVLITKIPPGGSVAPHVDNGWHARYYEKYAVQIKGNKDQAFCFDGMELRPEPGDMYTFDNSKTHWVNNDSDSDRITLIVCIRGGNA